MVDPIIVSYSELDTFRQCPLKHMLSYDQRWTKPKPLDSALGKGSLWHLVMEDHYGVIKAAQDAVGRTGRIPATDHGAVLAAAREVVMMRLWDGQAGRWYSDVHDLVAWMYDGYVEMYGVDSDWRILGIEHQIITPLRAENGRRTRYHLKAKIDLVVYVRSLGVRAVVDHKSGANLPTQMDLEIDDQFGLYQWAMKEVGRPVDLTLHSAARTQRNKSFMALDTRMSRTYLNRSDIELKNIALDAYQVARSAHPPKGERRTRYSSPDPRQCGWKCDFKEPHLLMRKGRNPSEVLLEYGYNIDRTRH